MRKTKLSKLISFLLCLTIVVTGIVTTSVVSNADNAESKVGQTGIAYKGSFVYKEANIDSAKAELSGFLSDDGSYQFTIIEELNVDGQTWYKYECDSLSMAATYPYVKKEDVTFPKEEVVLEGEVAGIKVSVAGNIPKDVRLSLADVDEATLDLVEYDIKNISDILTALDIKLVKENGTEWQPTEPVRVSIDAEALGLEDGDVVTIKHNHEGEVSTMGGYEVVDGILSFETEKFSIYVVLDKYENNWNFNNYRIVMTKGDSFTVSTSTTGNSYKWNMSGDTESFSLTNANAQKAIFTANKVGTIEVTCTITSKNSTKTEKIMIVSRDAVGDSISDDIIFANIDKDYKSGDTEYENTYGPYVMKIRFEDTAGNVLKYKDGTTVGDEYYAFDSAVPINMNTFSAVAPEGYTYTGSFFYWSGHYEGTKMYVSEVTRLAKESTAGSYLYFDHATDGASSVVQDDYYQPSGVLHIVYAKSTEAYEVIFKDHEGTDLHSYTVLHKDSGNKIPETYVTTLKDTLLNGIQNNHSMNTPGYEFTGNWVVSGGGRGIDGTYETDTLIEKIPKWSIGKDITVQAECIEKDVTINYVPKTSNGGSVSRNSETVKAVLGKVQGSTATAKEGYEFKGWYSDEDCTQLVSNKAEFVPEKVNGVNVAATYYAKFVENEVTINYVPVGPTGETNFGNVNPKSETVKVLSENAQGSTATAVAPKFKFVGWYDNAKCEGDALTTNVHFTPAKENGKNVAATYYAKFEYALADLTIKKSGINETIDANQTVLFKVEGTDENTSDIEMMVTVAGNGTVVIKDLPIGEYTVTEDMSWTSRYTNASNVRTGVKLTASGVTVEFDNTRSKDKWLDFNDSVDNIFKSNGIERNESN